VYKDQVLLADFFPSGGQIDLCCEEKPTLLTVRIRQYVQTQGTGKWQTFSCWGRIYRKPL